MRLRSYWIGFLCRMRLLLSRFKLVFVLCMHELGSRRRLFKLWGFWKLRRTGGA